jgi:hypothetical protein
VFFLFFFLVCSRCSPAQHYLRLGPHTVLTFLFWEKIKKAAEKAGI